jgi:hypothetical protein
MKAIFVVTMLKGREGETRAWAWYPTLEEANAAVLANDSDMFEGGTFTLAVVERVEPGWCVAQAVAWFEVAPSTSPTDIDLRVQPTECPTWAETTVNWGLG